MLKKAWAQVDIGDAFKIGNEGIGQPGSGYGSIGEFISTILPNVYVIAGLFLFILFIAGGFVIMSSGDNPEKKAKGSKALTAAVIGFTIIFTSYWIIQIIEYITGVAILQPGV